jgi:hypothetical protein
MLVPGFYNVHLNAERVSQLAAGAGVPIVAEVHMNVPQLGGSANFVPLVWALNSQSQLDGTFSLGGDRVVQVTSPNTMVTFNSTLPIRFNNSCSLTITLILRQP